MLRFTPLLIVIKAGGLYLKIKFVFEEHQTWLGEPGLFFLFFVCKHFLREIIGRNVEFEL